jgi:hypothetical protein
MVAVKYGDLSMAFDFVSFAAPMEHNAYVSLDTGEVYWKSEYNDAFDEGVPDWIASTRTSGPEGDHSRIWRRTTAVLKRETEAIDLGRCCAGDRGVPENRSFHIQTARTVPRFLERVRSQNRERSCRWGEVKPAMGSRARSPIRMAGLTT